jgi:hypothetical protein
MKKWMSGCWRRTAVVLNIGYLGSFSPSFKLHALLEQALAESLSYCKVVRKQLDWGRLLRKIGQRQRFLVSYDNDKRSAGE